MSRRRLGCVPLLAVVLGGALVALPGVASGDEGAAPGPLAPVASALSVVLGGEDPAAYWTEDRMRAAVPLDLDADGDRVPARSTAVPAAQRASQGGLTSPRSVGKLFFSDATSDYVCSAATLDTPEKDVIITAGHCVNTGGRPGLLGGCSTGRTYQNFVFVPRYANGNAPLGRWAGTRAIMHREWVEQCDAFAFDHALVELSPRNGRRIVEAVGGNGLALGFPARESGVRIWGWPADAPFDGETVRRCAGETYRFGSSGNDAAMECDMTGGASGGPWFISMARADVGYIWAVTSRRTIGGTPYLLAVPLNGQVRELLVASRSGRAVATSSVADTRAGRSFSSSGGLALRATPARVGRGQKVLLRAKTRPGTAVAISVRPVGARLWRRIAVGRTDASGIVDFAFRPTRVGGLRYRARTSRSTTSVPVRVLACPMPRSRAVAQDTACIQPTG